MRAPAWQRVMLDGNTDIVYGAPNDDDDSDPDAIIKDTGSVAVLYH